MKIYSTSFCVIVCVVCAIVLAPALAADSKNDSKIVPAISGTATLSAPAASAVLPAPAVPLALTPAGSATSAAPAVPEAPAAPAAPAVVSATPVEPSPQAASAGESSSIFGGIKKFFGAGEKSRSSMREHGGRSRPVVMPNSPMPTEDFADREKQVDPNTLEVAKRVAKLFNLKEQIRGPLKGETMRLVPLFEQENQGQTDKIQKSIDAAVDKVALAEESVVYKNKALFLAQNFTTEELDQLEKFFAMPVGQKLMKIADQITRNDSMFARRLATAERQQTREALIKDAKKNDLKIPKALEEAQ